MATIKWYFEDFPVGRKVEVGSHTFTEEEILAFATQFDPQPFHVNKEAAKNSIFGGLIASGWHTLSTMMRLMVDGFLNESASMGSPGVDQIRWIKPVHPGDTIQVSSVTLESRPSTSKPDRGVVISEWRAVNQHGELVCTSRGMGMFGRRPL
ncbi:MAG: MaoC family dehydratase [Herbaspirillum sp.]